MNSIVIQEPTPVHCATYAEKALGFYTKLGFVDTGKRFTENHNAPHMKNLTIPEMELILRK